VAIKGNFQDISRDIKMFIDFKILKVKVPIIFSGTHGFLARRDVSYKNAKHYRGGSKFQHYVLVKRL